MYNKHMQKPNTKARHNKSWMPPRYLAPVHLEYDLLTVYRHITASLDNSFPLVILQIRLNLGIKFISLVETQASIY